MREHRAWFNDCDWQKHSVRISILSKNGWRHGQHLKPGRRTITIFHTRFEVITVLRFTMSSPSIIHLPITSPYIYLHLYRHIATSALIHCQPPTITRVNIHPNQTLISIMYSLNITTSNGWSTLHPHRLTSPSSPRYSALLPSHDRHCGYCAYVLPPRSQ